MHTSVTYKDILKLAAPIALSQLIPQLNFFTNTAFLGRLGERELGVNGICGVYYLILSMIGYGLSNGIQIQMSRRMGENDPMGVARTLTSGMMLSVLLSLSLMLLSLWMAPIIFSLSLAESDNMYLYINFLYIRVWGLPFLMLTQLMNAFLIATRQSKFLIYGSVVVTVVNIVFDWLLIFGNMGFPQWGLEGAAVASVLAEVCFFVVMYGIYYLRREYLTYPMLWYKPFDYKLARKTLKVSAPLIVQYMFSIGGWLIFFFFVEHLGSSELAASQILRSVFGIIGIGTWAFAATCNTIVSHAIGRGKTPEVTAIIVKICKLSLGCTAVICLILFSFAEGFLTLYRDDPALVQLALPSLRIIVAATLIMSVSTVTFNGVVGTGNTFINLLMEITCVGSYLIYCYIVIQRMQLPLVWAWGSEFVYWSSLLLLSLLYLRSGRWRGKRI